MNYLITGGAGFIGSHLADRLLAHGHQVIIIDNLVTGKKENIAHLEENKNCRIYYNTILNRSLMDDLVFQCDEIFHMAAPVGVKWIMDHPIQTITDNVRGMDIMLELADKYQKKIFIASTSETYGEHNQGKISEDDKRIMGSVKNHRWAYACTKSLDEFLALAYHKEKNLQIVIGRFFNVVGPRQTDAYGMVLPTFIRQALDNQPLTVYGTGDQSRSLLYIDDLIDGLIAMMDEPLAVGDFFNLGNEVEITMAELAQKVIEAAQSTSNIVRIPYEIAYGPGFEDMQRRIPNIDKARHAIGFQPKYSINDIIQKMVKIAQHERDELILQGQG